MAINLRFIAIVLVLVGGITGLLVWKYGFAERLPCEALVFDSCGESMSNECKEMRSRLAGADLPEDGHSACVEYREDPYLVARLATVTDGARRARFPLPFEKEAWEKMLAERAGACDALAEQRAGEDPAVLEAIKALPNKFQCQLAIDDRALWEKTRQGIVAPLLAVPYTGKDPCGELNRRAKLVAPGASVIADGGFVHRARCQATLASADTVRAFVDGGANAGALAPSTVDPATLPWTEAAVARLPKAREKACINVPSNEDSTTGSTRTELTRRCREAWVAQMEGGAKLASFVVEEIAWIAPELAGITPDPLSVVPPWAGKKKSKKASAGGRLSGGCATLGVDVCAGLGDSACAYARSSLIGMEDDKCEALRPSLSGLKTLLSVADHAISKKSKPKLKIRGAKAAMKPVKCLQRREVTFRYKLKKNAVKLINAALKKARVKAPPLTGPGKTMGESKKLSVSVELVDTAKGSFVTVIERTIRK